LIEPPADLNPIPNSVLFLQVFARDEMAGLTTHVLDLSSGLPAAGVRIDVGRVEGEQVSVIDSAITNSDGRCDQPLLARDIFKPGTYELVFHIGDYFDQRDLDLPDPKFIDRVPIRFGVSDSDQHHHVPLLVSPYGYSTYRGS
jgi:5-hydroxyisourate hydrolase